MDTADRAYEFVDELVAKQEAQAMRDLMNEEEEPLEVTDGELVQLAHLLEELQFKYSHRPGTYENYKSLADEARERAGEEIGLDVYLDWMLPSMQVPPQPPIIRVNGRFTEFNLDKSISEIRSGVADQLWTAKEKAMKAKKR
jgi:hypothetical protein